MAKPASVTKPNLTSDVQLKSYKAPVLEALQRVLVSYESARVWTLTPQPGSEPLVAGQEEENGVMAYWSIITKSRRVKEARVGS